MKMFKSFLLLAFISVLLLLIVASCDKSESETNPENDKINVFEPWRNGPDLITGVNEASLVAHNGYLYLTGGVTAKDSQIVLIPDIQRAKINDDGSLESWEVIGNLPNSCAGHQSFVHNNNLYIIRGKFSILNNALLQIYAPINDDGSLGEWKYSSSGTMSVFTMSSSYALNDNIVYSLGGRWSFEANTDLVSTNTTYWAEILDNGELSSWKSTLNLTSKRDFFSSIIFKDYIYTFGGHYSSQNGINDLYYDQVETSKINDDNELNSWVSQGQLPNNAHSTSSLVYKDKVYLLSIDLAHIIFAELIEGGKLGDWKVSNIEFPAEVHHSAVLYGKHVYVLGGIIDDFTHEGSKKVFYTSFIE